MSLLRWVNQSQNSWNARSDGDSVVIEKRWPGGRSSKVRVFRDGGILFLSDHYMSGVEFREFNGAIGEARAYLNQPIYSRESRCE